MFNIKSDSYYRSWLVVKGFSQVERINFEKLFSLVCCSNHLLEWHLWYADFSKALSRLSSSGDYKRTRQGALAILILYIYYRLLVHATTIITCPYVHASSSCSITHPHVFFLRPLCFLHVPWCHTLNLCCTCAHHVYIMRNRYLLISLLTLTPSLDSFWFF